MKVKVILRADSGSCRKRAYLYIHLRGSDFLIAKWPVENSTCTKRYKPFKPVPPHAWFTLGLLTDEKLRELATFLLRANEGDTWEAEIQG